MRLCPLYGFLTPAQPSTELLSCIPDRSTYCSTEALENVQGRSTLPLTPFARMPVASSRDVDQEPLTPIYDEGEWDADILSKMVHGYPVDYLKV